MNPNTFRSQARRQVSLSTAPSVPGGMAPALLTRMSTAPAAAATRSTSSSRAKSAAMVRTPTWRCARTAAAAAASVAGSRAASTRSTPSPASAKAVARPMPFDPPVISARLPASSRSIAQAARRRPAA